MESNTLKLTAYNLWLETDKPIRSVIGKVSAGTPMEIVGEEEEIDLNYMLSRGSQNSMMIHVHGDSMCPEITDGDWVMLAMDREPMPGNIVVARLNGGYTIKRFKLNDKRGKEGLFLVPANGDYPEHDIQPDDDLTIVGVVTYILKDTTKV